MRANVIHAVLGCLFLAGCATVGNLTVETAGKLRGKTTVTWIGPDLFEYVPDPADPLTFVSNERVTVRPQRMKTDGGSIPPIFWSLPGFSPWGYGPAYVLHDWLFEQHHCQLPGSEGISFETSATILGEAIQTLMNTGMVKPNPEARAVIEAAVRSDVAKALWDKPNACVTSRPSATAQHQGAKPVIAVFDFSHGFPR